MCRGSIHILCIKMSQLCLILSTILITSVLNWHNKLKMIEVIYSSVKPETTVRDCVSTFSKVKPLDTVDELSGYFAAVLNRIQDSRGPEIPN